MKKIAGVTLLSTLLLSSLGFSSQAFAATTPSVKNSKATIEYTPGDDLDIDEKPDTDDKGDIIPGTGLPDNLYFGSHKIQLKDAENWQAHDKTTKAITTGTLKVNDARTTGAGWSIKVAQTSQFKNGTSTLDNAKLSIKTGAIENTGGVAPSFGAASTVTLDLDKGGEQYVFGARAGEGNGKSSLKLEQFDLAVPAIPKTEGTYISDLTWTLTDTPMS